MKSKMNEKRELVQPSGNTVGVSGTGWTFVGPVKSSIGSPIGIGNECQNALAQVSQRGPTGVSKQTANEDREPDLNLIEPGAVFRSIDEANAMAWLGEKGSPCF